MICNKIWIKIEYDGTNEMKDHKKIRLAIRTHGLDRIRMLRNVARSG